MMTLALAGPDDDSTLRKLLRDNPMPSWVSMASTREPSFFAGADRFGHDWAVIARNAAETIGMFSCSEQPVHLNGEAVTLGYLGGLRVSPGYRHRLRVLRNGYASILSLGPERTPELWYTAIASGNETARRLLEANLPGMPRYRPTNDLLTLALPVSRGRRHHFWRPATPAEMESLCSFYNLHAHKLQFAPVLSPERALKTGATFHVVTEGDKLLAVMALWDQRAYKQVVACAYRQPLGTLLPAYNLYARLARKVALPRVGQVLEQTSLAFLAVDPELEERIAPLMEDALALCPTAVMSFGLHAGHPWLDRLTRSFRPATYRTRIYAVDFGAAPALDERAAQPEVALL